MAVYLGLIKPGDTVLGLSLDHGGHLTHGSPVNASGILYNFKSFRVGATDERLDFDQIRELALEHKPKMIVAGTTSYPRRLEPQPFRAIADEVGALMMFRHRSHCRTCCWWCTPEPSSICRRRDVHYA
jgi:glycine hydroxymethyltransferase